MCLVNYELATDIYNNDTRNDEVKSVEQVKKDINEIISKSKLTPEPLTEQGAFMEWLLVNDIKEQYLKKYKENKKEKKKERIIMEQNNAAKNAIKIVEKTERTVEPIEPIIALDNLDEEMILAMEQAQEDLPLIYTYKEKVKDKMVLSWAGIVKAMRLQGNIKIDPPTFQEVNGKTIAMCMAHDLERNISMPGIAERASAGRMGAEFKYTVLASKAIRNAIKKIIDPYTLQKVMAEGKKRKSFVKVY